MAAFKIRLVILYHAAASLQRILGRHKEMTRRSTSSLLQKNAAERIEGMLVADPVRSVREKSSLRNHLVHYDLKPKVMRRIEPRLVPTPPLYGLVEAHASGRSLAELADEVERGLDCISEGIRALLPQNLAPEGTL